jgi:hypothetical protein
MLSLRQRLRRLERSPLFQHPPDPVNQIVTLVLRQVSDEDLESLIRVTRDRDAGVCRTLTQGESAAVAAYRAAVDVKQNRGHRR